MTPAFSDRINCCVIDDEPLAAALIARYVERTPFLRLAGSFTSAAGAIRTIKEKNVRLAMLDIEMPQLSGMEFAKILPPDCRVIFITAYDRYAVQGFRVNAVDYLLKPVSYEEFLEAAERARALISPAPAAPEREQDCIVVKCEYESRRINVADILMIEGVKNYIRIVLDDGSQVRTLLTMKAVEQMLPCQFMRVHRSFIVNTEKITSRRTSLLRLGDITVPVGETYRYALRNRLDAGNR